MNKSSLIKELVRLKNKAGLSQKELAEKIGIKQPQLSRVESGRQSPTLKTICLICDALIC